MGTAFYEQKGWWKSKTVWSGIIAVLVGILGLFGVTLPTGFDPTTFVEAVLALTGLGAIVGRVTATTKVGSTDTTTTA